MSDAPNCEWVSLLNPDCYMETCGCPATCQIEYPPHEFQNFCRKHAQMKVDECRGLVIVNINPEAGQHV